MLKRTALSLLALCLATGAQAAPTQSQLNSFAHDLGYRFTVLSNHVTQDCPAGKSCFSSQIDLTLPQTLPDDGWSLYVSLVAKFTGLPDDHFDFTHIQGDMYRITPKAGVTLLPGTTYSLKQVAIGTFFSEYYPMPNTYVAADGLTPAIVDATRSRIDPETGQESLPFVTPMTDEAALATGAPPDITQWLTPERAFELNAAREAQVRPPEFIILPTPASARHLGGKALDLDKGIALTLIGLSEADITPALASYSRSAKGIPLYVSVNGVGAPESYHIRAEAGRITITAADTAGAAYALQSLSQQAAFEHNHLKPLDIEDAPRFAFRGLHLDLARNFTSKAHVLKLITQMGRYKLNRLHLHLGDDEGWRLAIDGLPELTDIGSKRCHDLSEDICLLPQLGSGPFADAPVNGYLTRADYIEILKAAQANHIEVIPSFDMPGHSRAAVRSMEARYRHLMAAGQPEAANQYRLQDPLDNTVYSSIQSYSDNTLNICIPTTYAFINKVIDTVAAYHQAAGVPLKRYHIGADETAGAWTGSPACQAMMAEKKLTLKQMTPYFIEQVSEMLAKKGIEPAGWSDGMSHVSPATMPPVVQSNSWGLLLAGGLGDAHKHANQGWQVIMSSPEVLYFDMPYAPDPKERGYDWASRGTDLFKVFAFLPENLPANASLMTDLNGKGVTITDDQPLTTGHHISGMQGQLWSESIRSDAIADYMLFPRTLALAERAWHRANWEPVYVPGKSYTYGDDAVDQKALLADWQLFLARLAPQLESLDAAGLPYRLPVPGARIVNGRLEANSPLVVLAIEYRTDGGWHRYTGPVQVSGPVEIRTRSPSGRTSRIVPAQTSE